MNNDHLHKLHPRIAQEFTRVRSVCFLGFFIAVFLRVIDLSCLFAQVEGTKLTPRRVQGVIDVVLGGAKRLAALAPHEAIDAGSSQGDGNSPDATLALPQTMIFVNTAESALWFSEQLVESGQLPEGCVVQFHKLVEWKEKQLNLRSFQDGSARVMVCTDHAARGLDLPQVRRCVHQRVLLTNDELQSGLPIDH